MTRLTLTVFVLSICISSITAQNEFIYKIGAAFSDFVYDYPGDYQGSTDNQIYTGPLAGFEVSWRLSEKWCLKNGITYTRRGRANYSEAAGRLFPRDVTIHYASLPIQIEYSIVSRLSVNFGVEFSYFLRSSHNFFPDLNRFNYGPIAGVSWRQKKLIFSLSGYTDVLPFHDYQDHDDSYRLSMKYAQLSAGYVIQ